MRRYGRERREREGAGADGATPPLFSFLPASSPLGGGAEGAARRRKPIIPKPSLRPATHTYTLTHVLLAQL
jgi:hypothetical protein